MAALVIARLDNRLTLRAAGLLTAARTSLALATREPPLVVAGFLAVGLALAAVVPIAFFAAGYLAPERAGAAIAVVVTTLGYGDFFVGPMSVGVLAEILWSANRAGNHRAPRLLIFVLVLRLRTP